MSGSSLDGVDIAYCEFFFDTKWHYKILKAETLPYKECWSQTLMEMPNKSGSELIEYDIKFGKYLGKLTLNFIKKYNIVTEIISSHGHTIFHEPELGYTFQLGNGHAIAAQTQIKTICDFRIGDIQLGGQGAPLVPIGDELLFSEYDFCINIGGIANISFRANNKRLAFDVCPANQLLNYLSKQLGKPYDDNGDVARQGEINLLLFNKLNNHPYYSLSLPKSMSNQLVTSSFVKIIDESNASVKDKLHTVCKHIAYQISLVTKKYNGKTTLITGGGAHNSFLINSIKSESSQEIIIPNNEIVNYKEALVFAFMGVLRLQNLTNCIASATGATKDSSQGVIYE